MVATGKPRSPLLAFLLSRLRACSRSMSLLPCDRVVIRVALQFLPPVAAIRQGAATPHRADHTDGRVVPAIVFHADRDGTVLYRNNDQLITYAEAAAAVGLRASTERGRVPGRHAHSRALHTGVDSQPVLEQ